MKAGKTPLSIANNRKAKNGNARVYVNETMVLQIGKLDVNFRKISNMGVSYETIQAQMKNRLMKKGYRNLTPFN